MATLASASQLTSRPIVVVETTEERNAESIPPVEAEVEFWQTVVSSITTMQAALQDIKDAAIARLEAATPRRGPISD